MESSKTWTIVKFKEDNSVAVVPTTWITEIGNCLWPPFPSDKVTSAIKGHVTNTCWPTFKIDVFRNATYDNYETARVKCKRAEETSDLNTEIEDELLEMPKRRRISKRVSSSSEDSFSESILRTPPKITKRKTSAKYLKNNVTPSSNTLNIITQNEESTAKHTMNVTPSSSTIYNVAQNGDKGNCTCCPNHHYVDYLKQILNQQTFIKSLMTDILAEITSKNSRATEIADPNESVLNKFNLPIKEDDDFELLNRYLENEENFAKAATEFCKIGGKDNYDFVKRCMGILLTNEYAQQYSWLGRRQKKSFCNNMVSKLVIDAAHRAGRAKDSYESETSLKNWLRRARDRIK